MGIFKRRTLVDQLSRAIARDSQDAPGIDVQGAVLAQDLQWCVEQLAASQGATTTSVAVPESVAP